MMREDTAARGGAGRGSPATPGQTVGPFFNFALPFDGGPQVCAAGHPYALRIEGRILDGAAAPVPDALVETWQATPATDFRGFGRCPTDSGGWFHFVTLKPGPVPTGHGVPQAPHIDVIVFARGLLTHVLTRMYFPDEAAANEADPVLTRLPSPRRATLIAREVCLEDSPRAPQAGGTVLRFDIRLQGDDETVFFDV